MTAPTAPPTTEAAAAAGAGTLHPDAIEVRFGHPIRNFVLILASIALVALGCWWTGLLAPRIETSLRATSAQSTGVVIVTVEISNPTPLTVEVRSLDLRLRGVRTDRSVVGNRRSTIALGHFSLASGDHRLFTVFGHITDCDWDRELSDGDLEITARTPLGITRVMRQLGLPPATLRAPASRCPPG